MIRTILISSILLVSTAALHAQEHRIEYRWLNQPCSEILSCNTGCSACNMPANADGYFFGTNAAFIGVSTCPLPVSSGDNAVYTDGWTVMPTADRTVIISGIATVPVHIDSIIFRHAIHQDGPTRLKVSFTNNAAVASQEVLDVEVPAQFEDVVLTDLGCVEFPEGAPMGTFQIRFTPYDGGSGGWALDEVRIIASNCATSTVGLVELQSNTPNKQGPWFDLLGRPIAQQPAPGIYINPAKRVRVF
ncbi:MAG: hypothetical protein IPP83_14295 [Flavobacteriales bacterium]|nr:hypothetical protein [Flavobacteriales bacterium]